MTNEDLEPSDDDLEGIALDRNNFIFFSSEIKKINLDLEAKCRDGNWTAEKLSLLYSLPEWMIHQFIEQYGFEQAAAIGESLNHTAPLTLRVNTLKASVDECRAQLEKEGVATKKTKYSPFGLCVQKRLNIFQLQSFRSGLFEVQDEGSQILPLLLDPKPRSKVVDACSGGGGKSLELAALMKNRGVIFALDVNAHRLDDLRKRIRRSGSDTIRVQLVKEHNVPDSLVGVADNVLVDAPCSGLGTLRRNPGMKWTTTPDAISELSSKQYEILSEYSQCVKQNGRLVYATCTLTADENERVVEKFLTSHSDFELMRPSHILERYGLQGLEIGHYLRLFPHVHGTDGFFAAVMKRKVI